MWLASFVFHVYAQDEVQVWIINCDYNAGHQISFRKIFLLHWHMYLRIIEEASDLKSIAIRLRRWVVCFTSLVWLYAFFYLRKRLTGEEWMINKPGAYLPEVYEEVKHVQNKFWSCYFLPSHLNVPRIGSLTHVNSLSRILLPCISVGLKQNLLCIILTGIIMVIDNQI